MTVNDLVPQIRSNIHDINGIEFTSTDLLNYLNDAINYLSTFLISINDPEMIIELPQVNHDDNIPADYCIAIGKNPLSITNGKFKLFNTNEPILNFRYYAYKPAITSLDQVIPFKDFYATILVRIVSIYALNCNDYDVTQDWNIVKQMLDSIVGARNNG